MCRQQHITDLQSSPGSGSPARKPVSGTLDPVDLAVNRWEMADMDPLLTAHLSSRRRFIGGGTAAAALILGPSFLAACESDRSGPGHSPDSDQSAVYTEMMAVPAGINAGLNSASPATMMKVLGNPGNPEDTCGTPSPPLTRLLKTADVGPFRVTGLFPAIDALTRVFSAVKSNKPDLYGLLGTAGMLCVRHVRGSTVNLSNHSWGTAVDITVCGTLTPLGSPTVQRGIVELAPFMHAQRFYWGAGFHRVDGMHFEASNELVMEWKANGLIP